MTVRQRARNREGGGRESARERERALSIGVTHPLHTQPHPVSDDSDITNPVTPVHHHHPASTTDTGTPCGSPLSTFILYFPSTLAICSFTTQFFSSFFSHSFSKYVYAILNIRFCQLGSDEVFWICRLSASTWPLKLSKVTFFPLQSKADCWHQCG